MGEKSRLFSRGLVWKANYLSRQKVEHYPIPGIPYSVQFSYSKSLGILNDVSGHSAETQRCLLCVDMETLVHVIKKEP